MWVPHRQCADIPLLEPEPDANLGRLMVSIHLGRDPAELGLDPRRRKS